MEEKSNIIDFPAQSSNFECEICGSNNGSITNKKIFFDYKNGEEEAHLSALVPVSTCAECGEEILNQEAEIIKHEAVCRHLGVLTPAEISSLRKSYGLSREKFSEITKIGVASLARWEAGLLIQSLALDRYLRLMSKTGGIESLANLFSSHTNEAVKNNKPVLRNIRYTSQLVEKSEQFLAHI